MFLKIQAMLKYRNVMRPLYMTIQTINREYHTIHRSRPYIYLINSPRTYNPYMTWPIKKDRKSVV